MMYYWSRKPGNYVWSETGKPLDPHGPHSTVLDWYESLLFKVAFIGCDDKKFYVKKGSVPLYLFICLRSLVWAPKDAPNDDGSEPYKFSNGYELYQKEDMPEDEVHFGNNIIKILDIDLSE